MHSRGMQGINRTLYQDKKSQGQGQQQQGIETTGVLIILVYFSEHYS